MKNIYIPKNLGRTFALAVTGVLMIMAVVTGTLILAQGDDVDANAGVSLGSITITHRIGNSGCSDGGLIHSDNWGTLQQRTFNVVTAPGSDPVLHSVALIETTTGSEWADPDTDTFIILKRPAITYGAPLHPIDSRGSVFRPSVDVAETLSTRTPINGPHIWSTINGSWLRVEGTIEVLYRDYRTVLPFHRSDTGAFIANAYASARPGSTHIFTLPANQLPAPPLWHQWQGTSVSRTVPESWAWGGDGRGPVLARQDIWAARIQSTIMWNPNGGTWTDLSAPQNTQNRSTTVGQGLVPSGAQIPPNPVRDGYTFTGWSPDHLTTVTGNRTHTAQWSADAVTAIVPFHRADTGEFIANVSVTALPNTEQTFTLPDAQLPTPPADHHWTNYSITRNIGNGGTLARQDVQLERYLRAITWDPNGGIWTTDPPAGISGGAINTSINRTSSEGQGLTPADTRPGTLTRDGYTFIGWSPSGAVPASNQTRVAQWERIPVNPPVGLSHVRFILRSSTHGISLGDQGMSVRRNLTYIFDLETLPNGHLVTQALSGTGLTLLGWATQENGPLVYSLDDLILVLESRTLWAVYG